MAKTSRLSVIFDEQMRAVGTFSEESAKPKGKDQPTVGVAPMAGQKILDVELPAHASKLSQRNILRLLNRGGETIPGLAFGRLPIKIKPSKNPKS